MRGGLRCLSAAALTVVLLASSGPAFAQTTADTILRVKSVFAGSVWRADVSADESYVAVSNAYDSVSSWAFDLPDAAAIARVPVRDEERKRAHAVALDPAGEMIAYSVPPVATERGAYRRGSSVIYLVRRSTGEIIRVLDQPAYDIATRPQAMRFSPDGRHLAATLSSGCGLRVWSTQSWELVAKDDVGYGGVAGQDVCCRSGNIEACDRLPNTNSLAFHRGDAAGEAQLIISGDTGVRSYRLAGDRLGPAQLALPQAIDLDRPAGIAISPDGDSIVIGDRGTASTTGPQRFRVALLDRRTLRPLQPPLEVTDAAVFGGFLQGGPQLDYLHQFAVDRVAWIERGGRDYVFAGSVPCHIALSVPPLTGNRDVCLLRWTLGEPLPAFVPAGLDRARDLLALPQRGGVLVVSPTLIALLAVDGTPLLSDIDRTFVQRNAAADLRGAQLEFSISPDAQAVRFENYQAEGGPMARIAFDLRALPQPLVSPDTVAMTPPNQNATIVAGWMNSRDPRIQGQPLPGGEIRKDEIFRSAAVDAGKKRVLLGSSEFLRIVSYAGSAPIVACREPITEEAFRVNISADGNIAVVAHGDGAIRWYRIEEDERGCTLALLLSVRFSRTTSGQVGWIAWRPDGRHAQDISAPEGLEWQTLEQGRVMRTPFERLQSWYDVNAVKAALTAPPQQRTGRPDRDHVVRQAERQPVIDVLRTPPAVRATAAAVPLGLRFGGMPALARRLSVRVNNTPAAIEWTGATYAPGEDVQVTAQRLIEGRLELKVLLPPNARTSPAQFQICFYLEGIRDRCHVMTWVGELVKPKKRRLWAVFVGVARHADHTLDLEFADNDVLDLAKLFVSDYEKRVRPGPRRTNVSADFQNVRINLALSGSPEAEQEAAALAAGRPYVKRYGATRSDIIAAIDDMVDERAKSAEGSDLGDDLFLFYFSGHGIIAPTERDQGRTLFATAQSRRDNAFADDDQTTLDSLTLLDLFETVPGEKLVVFDACRSLSQAPEASAFDPNLLMADLTTRAVSADVFFSSDAGQPSREVAGLAFDGSRPPGRRGNSLFTYALLRGLTTDATVLLGTRSPLVSVKVLGLAWYFDSVFFNTDDQDGEGASLMKKHGWTGLQKPVYRATRAGPSGASVVRTFARSPAGR